MSRPKKNPAFVSKTCPTCLSEFQISTRKKHQVYCSRSCGQRNPETIRKMVDSRKGSSLKKYGVDHPMKTKEVVKNFKYSMMKKYGNEHALKNKVCLLKSKSTRLKRYGDENFNNTEKYKSTCLERYGVDNYKKTSEYKLKYKKTCLDKYDVEHSSQSKSFTDSHRLTMFKKFFSDVRFSNFKPMFSIEGYQGITKGITKYDFQCIRCNTIESHAIDDGKWPQCLKCDKKYSAFQTEIQNFITSIIPKDSVIINDRKVLYPREIDILIPSKKLAIECDSLSFHSEIFGCKNKLYHLGKTKNSLFKEIKMVHIWDSEWKDKNDIVKSILSNMLGKTEKTIFARKCKIEEISPKESSEFLKENHIQGVDHPTVRLGLFSGDKVVSVMTFCKSRFSKNYEWEMSRFCNRLNTSIVGGASKLFKYFIKKYNPKNVVSYSDRRYFNGLVYLNLGFEFIDNTPPNYHYILNGYSNVQNRINWQKHKLKEKLLGFDETLTEWENMKNHGFDRIWDCGHGKWVYSNKFPSLP